MKPQEATVLARKLVTQPRRKDLNLADEGKKVMEVQGCHRELICRLPARKQVPAFPSLVADAESSRKKVSFEQSSDAERKTRREKPSVVITLPVKSEKVATRGTQTDFRESETQTVPWKHEIRTGEKLLAELLSFDWFHLENNSPPGMKEVTQMEQARQRLAWENVIDRLRGKENDFKRKSLVLRIAANESAWKEWKKDEENQERLDISVQQLRDARNSLEEKLWMRLQRSYGCRKRENFSKISRWNHQLSRRIRQAKAARERPVAKLDIIAMHKDSTSDLYAPKLRSGKISPWHEVIDIRCRYLKRFHGLEILEKHMTDFLDLNLSECFKSKSKKMEVSWRKFVAKIAEQPKERKLASISLKIAVPASTPEPPTTRRTRLPSDCEENLRPASLLCERLARGGP